MTLIYPDGFSILSLLRGILGLFVILGLCYLISFNRKRIDWKLVGGGLFLQLILALSVLYIPYVGNIFELAGKVFLKVMDFTQDGIRFLIGPYADKKTNGFVFLFHAIPVIIFFSALVSLFYHWGIIQRVVQGFSWILRRFFNISGAEGLVVSGNIFMGMTESPVLVKNYLSLMNKSELFLVMVSGMGTIAGTVMGTYIGMLGSNDPAARLLFAKHLLSASVMAAPASIVIAKMLCPQTEHVENQQLSVQGETQNGNALEAVATGTATGVRLMVNIAAMLLVFIAFIGLINYISEGIVGKYSGLNEWVVQYTGGKSQGLTIQFILGQLLAPFMWLIGIPTDDISLVGSLLGQKTVLNEFVAYAQLQQWKDAGMFVYQKSIVMSTYILCGFANISSIGILIGGIGVLAPGKRELITRLGIPAMIAGALVSILSATIVGMILG